MSLSSALSIAKSSLSVIQTEMALASANIANADDTNYTTKTANQASVVTASAGSGVTITGITSKVDANLVRSIVDATSDQYGTATTSDYLESLSNSLGTLSSSDSGDTLATYLAAVQADFESLATTPESTTLATQLVADLDDMTSTLQSASDNVQTLRSNADSDIESAVDNVNDALYEIDSYNKAIASAQANGQSTADLEDQRNAALQTVAQNLAISYFTDSSGTMYVSTSSGQLLVGSTVHELSFTATSGTLSTDQTYEDGDLSGVTVDGNDITSTITTGNIGALLELRDETLVDVQDQLDTLAANIISTLNDEAAAQGVSDLLSGSDATDIAVDSTLLDDPTSITWTEDAAQAIGDAMSDADLAGDAGDIVSTVGTWLSSAETRATSAETTLTTLTETFQSKYGVNVDEETARITELETAYAASAKILTAVQSMFDDLMNAVD